jgi:uncharacterized protein YabE (DUF348 family)
VSPRRLVAGGAVLAVALLTNAYAQNNLSLNNKAYADGQHLVSVYVDGNKRVIATPASTVGKALDQIGVEVAKGDVVEPNLDTVIDQPIYNVNIYRAMPATIFDDGKKVQVLTGYQSPRQIIVAAGLSSYPEDIVSMQRVDDFNAGGTVGRQIVIDRARPVQVIIAGQVYNFRTQKETVGELLSEKGLAVGADDVMSANLDSPLSAGQRIVVNRLSQTISQGKEAIPFTVQYEYDGNQPVGYTAVKQDGRAGTKLVSFVVDLKDGAETGRRLLEEKVLEPAVVKVVVKGSKVDPVGDNALLLYKLRMCETGGDYRKNTGNGYYGAYQFMPSTWNKYGTGYALASEAPAAVQDAVVLRNARASAGGFWSQHPGCSAKLSLPKFPY